MSFLTWRCEEYCSHLRGTKKRMRAMMANRLQVIVMVMVMVISWTSPTRTLVRRSDCGWLARVSGKRGRPLGSRLLPTKLPPWGRAVRCDNHVALSLPLTLSYYSLSTSVLVFLLLTRCTSPIMALDLTIFMCPGQTRLQHWLGWWKRFL